MHDPPMHVNLMNKKGFCNFNQNVIIFSASGGGKNIIILIYHPIKSRSKVFPTEYVGNASNKKKMCCTVCVSLALTVKSYTGRILC